MPCKKARVFCILLCLHGEWPVYPCGPFSTISLDRHTCRNEVSNIVDVSWKRQNNGKGWDTAESKHLKISSEHYTKYCSERSKLQWLQPKKNLYQGLHCRKLYQYSYSIILRAVYLIFTMKTLERSLKTLLRRNSFRFLVQVLWKQHYMYPPKKKTSSQSFSNRGYCCSPAHITAK